MVTAKTPSDQMTFLRSFADMKNVSYVYQRDIHHTVFEQFIDGTFIRFRVRMSDNSWMVISFAGLKSLDEKIIWEQYVKPGEVVQPYDLVQTIGEAMEPVIANIR